MFKRNSSFWTRREKQAPLSTMWCTNSKTSNFETVCFAAKHVSCNIICESKQIMPGVHCRTEHGTKQVIINQSPHQPVTDASSGMPNKKPNGMPGLHSVHPALPQEEGQMVPVTQKNAKRLPSHSNGLCRSPVTVCHPCKRHFSRT